MFRNEEEMKSRKKLVGRVRIGGPGDYLGIDIPVYPPLSGLRKTKSFLAFIDKCCSPVAFSFFYNRYVLGLMEKLLVHMCLYKLELIV